MDLKKLLTNIPSGRERAYYISVIGNSQKKFDELLGVMMEEMDPVKWRAAWILDGCDEKFPALSEKHLSVIVNRLPHLNSDGTLRSMLKLLTRHSIPENDQGLLVDLCFSYLASEVQPVAVKVYAMQILYNFALIYPEIGHELRTIIEDQFENNSAGFKARGLMILNLLK